MHHIQNCQQHDIDHIAAKKVACRQVRNASSDGGNSCQQFRQGGSGCQKQRAGKGASQLGSQANHIPILGELHCRKGDHSGANEEF